MRRWLALAAFTFVMVGCVTLAFELLLRAFVTPSWIVPADPDEDALLVPDAKRGYALAAELDRRWSREDWAIAVRTNELGLRGPAYEVLRAAPRRALAVGDSFTMGLGVEADEAWPIRLESRLSDAGGEAWRFANAGVPGYSTRQMRETAEWLVPLLEPDLVVAAHFASSQWRVEAPYTLFGRQLVLSSARDRMALQDDGTVVRSVWPEGRLRRLDLWLMQRFHLGARILHVLGPALGAPSEEWVDLRSPDPRDLRRVYAPTLAELGRIQAIAEEAGARFYVLLVNRQEFDGSFSEMERLHNRIVSEYGRSMGIPVIDPLDRLVRAAAGEPRFVFPNDIHWTPAAHDLAAAALSDGLFAGEPDRVESSTTPRVESGGS